MRKHEKNRLQCYGIRIIKIITTNKGAPTNDRRSYPRGDGMARSSGSRILLLRQPRIIGGPSALPHIKTGNTKMTLEEIVNQIRKMDVATIEATHADISKKMQRARNPQIRLGYALIIENLELQKFIKTTEPCDMSDEELLAELTA
jgi:hypothetical protein